MKRIALLLLGLLFLFSGFAQQLQYARMIIDSLASPQMHGRAYCLNGDQKAAQFILRQISSLGLKPLTPSYVQHFEVSKNCITDSILLFIDGRKLVVGKDFLIMGNTPTIVGNFKLLYIRKPWHWKRYAKQRLDSTFVVVSAKRIQKAKNKRDLMSVFRSNRLNAAGVIILQDNFYYRPSIKQANFALIYAKPELIKPSDKSISIKVRAKVEQFKTQNILAYLPGQVDSFIVFTAHYDHLGVLGQVYFPGANDNASGTAMLLALAKDFKNHNVSPKYNIAFIFFSAEELGLLGSLNLVEKPVFDLKKIKLLINLDMVGSGDQGITIVNGKQMPQVVSKINQINQQYQLLPDIKLRKNAPNSDHYPFTLVNVPAIFIYTRGQYKEYHNIYDRASALPLNKFEQLEKLLYHLALEYQNP